MDNGEVDWRVVLRLADQEAVGPLLWGRLRDKELICRVPEEPRKRLKWKHHITVVKNERFKQQAIEIAQCLNDIGTIPIIMKGGVALFEGPGAHSGSPRVMTDLDLIVPQEGMDQSIEALLAIGYRTEDQDERWTYHYPPLSREDVLATVDLHLHVGEQRDILPAEKIWRVSVPLDEKSAQLRMLSPNHMVVHNVFHSQIQDRGHEFGFLFLKQLCDLDEICRRYARDIDWDTVFHLFEASGLAGQLHYRLLLAERLLGTPIPRQRMSTASRNLRYRFTLLHIGWDWYREATLFLAALTHPFKKRHIEFLYDCNPGLLGLNAYRLRHLAYLLSNHSHHLGEKVKENVTRLR